MQPDSQVVGFTMCLTYYYLFFKSKISPLHLLPEGVSLFLG